MKILHALLFPVIWLSCTPQKEVAEGTTDALPVTDLPAQQEPVLGGASPADSLVISLQRTPCFGQCKAYTINVYRSGYATFNGRSNVELEGLHHARVGLDTLRTLLAEAERIGFYQLDDVYDRNVTDLPSSILRLVGNGKDKRVVGRVGTPENFTRFFTKAEEMLFPIAWRPAPKAE